MTEALRAVLDEIEKLPEEEQNRLAELLEREVEEREWEAITSKPGSERFLSKLVEEALEEDRAGRTVESDDNW